MSLLSRLRPSNVTLFIFSLAFLVLIAGTCYNYYFIQDQNDTNNEKQSIPDVYAITHPSQKIEKVIKDPKENTKVALSGQNDTLFSESFEGSIKIVNVTSTSPATVTSPSRPTPTINDPHLKIETIINGIAFPTSMAFLGPNDILVLEKDKGTVRRVVNNTMLDEPLLDVNVANKAERGMLGIAITKQESKNGDKPNVYVFLYYTETKSKDGEDLEEGGVILGNRLYRYELVNNKLINPKLLLDLPAKPDANHQGGVVLIGPDQNVYLVIGYVDHFTQAQNQVNGKEPDGTGGILAVTQNGKPLGKNMLGSEYPLNLYYAYGIRNSFGMDFDPVSGNLWDTENGPDFGDEINLVEQGFNSGWTVVQGIWEINESDQKVGIFDETSEEEKLVDFDGKGKYRSPEFVWDHTVGPSALKFFTSDKLGKEYRNDMFIGDVNQQDLYHFDLTADRKELALRGQLINKIAENKKELNSIIFARGLGRITDIDVGTDGNLYILSHSWNNSDQYLPIGSIFKISKTGY
jgi:glucose/arabinose dehydrogenase